MNDDLMQRVAARFAEVLRDEFGYAHPVHKRATGKTDPDCHGLAAVVEIAPLEGEAKRLETLCIQIWTTGTGYTQEEFERADAFLKRAA